MRISIDIDDKLMAEARKASGLETNKEIVEQALRLMVKLRWQRNVVAAFSKYPRRGNLAWSSPRNAPP
jgi:Arc/MetJ family transcription regulator